MSAARWRSLACIVGAYVVGMLVMEAAWELQSAWFILVAFGGGAIVIVLAVIGARDA